MSKHVILGLFWLEEEYGNAMAINCYINMLNEFRDVLGHRRSFQREEQWLQQDGATAHIANESRE